MIFAALPHRKLLLMLSLTRLQRFGIAVVGVLLIAALRLALDSILREDLPLFFFVVPIIVAGWCGGLWPGLLATGLSLFLGDYLFMSRAGSIFHHGSHLNYMRAATLAFTGIGFSILFERNRRAVRALHESRRLAQNAEAKANFMVQLNEALLRLETPEQIMAASVQMLGEYLKVDRCGYAEIDHDKNQFVVKAEYIGGAVSSILGCYTLSDFGQNEQQILKDHSAYVVSDIEAEPSRWSGPGTLPPGTNPLARVCTVEEERRVPGENGRPPEHAAPLVE